MGLMDILTGMQNGPRGAPQQAPAAQKSGGMSPIMMALLGLLAYKAFKGSRTGNTPSPGSMPAQTPPTNGGLGGILGNIFGNRPAAGRPVVPPSGGGGLSSILGGMLGGAAAGTVLNGGLGNLLGDLQRSGHSQEVQSWVGRGQNEPIPPDDLARALGADTINSLSEQSGLSRDELVQGLSQNLPDFVDQLTPEGRLPTETEAAQW